METCNFSMEIVAKAHQNFIRKTCSFLLELTKSNSIQNVDHNLITCLHKRWRGLSTHSVCGGGYEEGNGQEGEDEPFYHTRSR